MEGGFPAGARSSFSNLFAERLSILQRHRVIKQLQLHKTILTRYPRRCLAWNSIRKIHVSVPIRGTVSPGEKMGTSCKP
jgi:hypothetical protein